MKLSIAFVFWLMLMSAETSAQTVHVPQEWWGDEVSVEAVEDEESRYRSKMVSKLRSELAEDLRRPDITKEQAESMARHIERIEEHPFVSREDWTRMKSEMKQGDRLLRFAAPPLRGPFGYVLVRKGVAIDVVYIGDS